MILRSYPFINVSYATMIYHCKTSTHYKIIKGSTRNN